METVVVDEQNSQAFMMVNPITFVLQFLASYGWYLVGAAGVAIYLVQKMRPRVQKWKEEREDAEDHKNPDRTLARMEAIQRIRDKQQQELEQATRLALEKQKEREERKRAENLERLEKYGAAGGRRLGRIDDSEYLPLSGGGSSSSYRPPKRSACRGGGCGR